MPPVPIPYCGAGPTPSEILSRWNFDPWLLGALALAGVVYGMHRRRGGEGRDLCVLGALATLALVFVSPLCALGSALFSARVVHHAVLVGVTAPLLAYGLPQPIRLTAPPLAAAAFVQAILFWTWHSPAAYAWALASDAAYWVMQVALLGSALAFWAAVRRAPGLAAAAALLATMVQMGLLGALITFAGRPLYAPHLTTTQAWGLEPLEDQQLAGLIMWAPMSGAYLAAAVVILGRWLGREGRLGAPARC